METNESDDDEMEFRKSLNSKNHTINVYRQVELTGEQTADVKKHGIRIF